MSENWKQRAEDAEERLKILEIDLSLCRAANLSAKALYQAAHQDLTKIAEDMGTILGMHVPVDDLRGIMEAAIKLAHRMYPEEFKDGESPASG